MRKADKFHYFGVCAFLLALTGCDAHNETQSTPGDAATTIQQKPVEASATAQIRTSITISIERMKFQPDNISVSSGDTIIFVNHDMVEHDVTEETKHEWKSKPLAANASWRFVPTKSANYFCSIHPVMKGKITVQ